MNKLPYAVTEDIILKIKSISKDKILNLKNEIQIAEPNLYKWAKDAVKEEVREIKYSGVTIPSEELVKFVGSIILQSKIEGFLIGLMSQDQEWNNQFLLDDKSSETPYSIPSNALLEGKLSKEYYIKMSKEMTDDERKDINNWKNKAIAKFEENNKKLDILNKANKFLSDNDEKPPTKGPGLSPTPNVNIGV